MIENKKVTWQDVINDQDFIDAPIAVKQEVASRYYHNVVAQDENFVAADDAVRKEVTNRFNDALQIEFDKENQRFLDWHNNLFSYYKNDNFQNMNTEQQVNAAIENLSSYKSRFLDYLPKEHRAELSSLIREEKDKFLQIKNDYDNETAEIKDILETGDDAKFKNNDKDAAFNSAQQIYQKTNDINLALETYHNQRALTKRLIGEQYQELQNKAEKRGILNPLYTAAGNLAMMGVGLAGFTDSFLNQGKPNSKLKETIKNMNKVQQFSVTTKAHDKDGFKGNILKGRVGAAADFVVRKSVESSPISMIALASGMIGLPEVGLALIGTLSTGGQYAQLTDDTFNGMPEQKKIFNSALNGMSEVITEQFGTMKNVAKWGKLAKRIGRQQAQDQLSKEMKRSFLKSIGERTAEGFKEEFLEEGFNGIAGNAIAYATGETDEFNLTDGVIDDAFIGGFSSLGLTGTAGVAQIALAKAQYKAQLKDIERAAEIEKLIGAEYIKSVIPAVNKFKKKINGRYAPDYYGEENLNTLNKQIENIEASIESGDADGVKLKISVLNHWLQSGQIQPIIFNENNTMGKDAAFGSEEVTEETPAPGQFTPEQEMANTATILTNKADAITELLNSGDLANAGIELDSIAKAIEERPDSFNRLFATEEGKELAILLDELDKQYTEAQENLTTFERRAVDAKKKQVEEAQAEEEQTEEATETEVIEQAEIQAEEPVEQEEITEQAESTPKPTVKSKSRKPKAEAKKQKTYVRTSKGVFEVERETDKSWILTNGTIARKSAKGNSISTEMAYKRSLARRKAPRKRKVTDEVNLRTSNITPERTPFLDHFKSTGMQTSDVDLKNYRIGIKPLFSKDGVELDRVMETLSDDHPLWAMTQGDTEAYKQGLLGEIDKLYNLGDGSWDEADMEQQEALANQRQAEEEAAQLLKKAEKIPAMDLNLNDKVKWVDPETGLVHEGVVVDEMPWSKVIQNNVTMELDDFESLYVLDVQKATPAEVAEKKEEFEESTQPTEEQLEHGVIPELDNQMAQFGRRANEKAEQGELFGEAETPAKGKKRQLPKDELKKLEEKKLAAIQTGGKTGGEIKALQAKARDEARRELEEKYYGREIDFGEGVTDAKKITEKPAPELAPQQSDIEKQALNYKTPEEFIDSFSLYHGTPAKIQGGVLKFGAGEQLKKGGYMGGHFLTDEKQAAESFRMGGEIYRAHGDIKNKVFDVNKNKRLFRNFIGKKFKNEDGNMETFTKSHYEFMFPDNEDADWATVYTDVVEYIAKPKGYWGMMIDEYAGGVDANTYQLWQDEIPIYTEQQLTDIWNKANQQPADQLPDAKKKVEKPEAAPAIDLVKEAKKYKTAEEFVKSQIGRNIFEYNGEKLTIDAVKDKEVALFCEDTNVTSFYSVDEVKSLLLKQSDINKEIEYKRDQEALIAKELERKKSIEEQKRNLYGYENTLDAKGKVRVANILDNKIRTNDIGIVSKRDFILKRILEDGNEVANGIMGKRNKNGNLIGSKLNKTESKFAEWVQSNKQQLTDIWNKANQRPADQLPDATEKVEKQVAVPQLPSIKADIDRHNKQLKRGQMPGVSGAQLEQNLIAAYKADGVTPTTQEYYKLLNKIYAQQLPLKERKARYNAAFGEAKYRTYNEIEDFYQDFLEIENEFLSTVVNDFNNNTSSQKWIKLKPQRIKKILRDFAISGVVRDEKGVDQVSGHLIRNILKLRVNNIIAGHTDFDPIEYIQEHHEDFNPTEKDFDDFVFDYLYDEKSKQMRISDYGSPKLEKLAKDLYLSTDYNAKVRIIDQILNVVHQRSDLAELFVEGGSSILEDISEQRFRTALDSPASQTTKTDLMREAGKILGTDNAEKILRFVEKITTPDGREALGKYEGGLIDIVMGRGNPSDTFLHECVHWAEDLLEEDELSALEKAMPDAEDRAEGVIAYRNGTKTLSGKIKRIVDKLLRTIRRLFGKQRKIDVLYDFYDKLMAGYYAQQGAITDNMFTNLANAFRTSADEARKQYEAVKLVKDKNGNLLAPNGKKSNLNEHQWRQVRTQFFKDWFGDWENDPDNASKVVDENGEPMVVYHGTPNAMWLPYYYAKKIAIRLIKKNESEKLKEIYKKINSKLKERNAAKRVENIDDVRFMVNAIGFNKMLGVTESELNELASWTNPNPFDYIEEHKEQLSEQELTKLKSDTFVEFSQKMVGTNTKSPDAKAGFFFTDDSEFARRFTYQKNIDPITNTVTIEQPRPKMYSVYLSIKNPVQAYKMSKQQAKELSAIDGIPFTDSELLSFSKTIDGSKGTQKWLAPHINLLIKNGYDGIVNKVKFENKGRIEYIAFSPTQIKSATANVGTFSADTADIRYREYKPGALSEALKKVKPEIKQSITQKVNETPLSLNYETFLQKAQRKLQDSLSRSGQVVEEAKKVAKVSDEIDFRERAELFIGKASRVIEKKQDQFNISKDDSFTKRLIDAGYDIEQLDKYLMASFAPTVNQQVLEKFGKENGSGMTDAQAEEIMQKYEGSDIKSFAEEYRKEVTQKSLQMMYDSGLISKELYDKFSAQKDLYVPLKRDKDTTRKGRGTGQGYSVTGRGIKARKGRTTLAASPFVNGLLDFQDTVVRSEKNKVGQSVLKFAEAFPDYKAPNGKPLFEVRSQQYIPVYDKNGEIDFFNRRYKIEDNELSVWVDGKQKIITINDDSLARGLKNLGLERGVKFLNAANTFLRSVITMLSPEFMITNFERDIQTAMINITTQQKKNIQKEMVKNVIPAIRGGFSAIRGGSGSKWANVFNDYADNGGKTGWFENKNFDEVLSGFEKNIKRYKANNKPIKAARETINFIMDMNEAVENGIRIAAYEALVRRGVSKQKAAVAAKNLTVNFNKKGEWGAVINSLYLFSNASIQGTAIIAKSLKNKKVQRVVIGLIAMAVLQNVINRHIDDDEYEKLDPYIKDNNWIYMLPNGKHIKIRVPFGYSIFNVLGNVIADAAYGDIDMGEAISRLFSGALDAFNPFGSTPTVAQLISPTVVDPIVQISENKNFFGGPIRPDQPPYQPKVPESELYFKSVRPQTKAITDWVYKITGGEDGKDWYTIDISPENIDHIIDFLGGGLGKFVSNTIATGTSLAKDGEFPALNKIPILRTTYGESSDYHNLRVVYDMLQESGRTKFSVRKRTQFYDALRGAVSDGKITNDTMVKMKNRFDKAQGLSVERTNRKRRSRR